MAGIEVRVADRRTSHLPRPGLPTFAAMLVAALLATAAPVGATGLPATARPSAATALLMPDPAAEPPVEPGEDPADPPPVDPPTHPEPTVAPPTETPTEPVTTPPTPPQGTDPPEVPATGEPAPPSLVPPTVPGQPGATPALPGGHVTTSDIVLTPAYWNSREVRAELRVTVTNTGAAGTSLRLAYTLPAGVSDAGTPGCSSPDRRHYRCGAWTAAADARFTMRIPVRVDGDAWRQMPLNGSVEVSATVPGRSDRVNDRQGFAVLFPPGPPVPGMTLDADEVSFDITGGGGTLDVLLGNTGTVDAAGEVEIVLPDGVSVNAPPAGCAPAGTARTRCALGTVNAGRQARLRVPVDATPQAQRSAPLAGAVTGLLTPRTGTPKRMQMSFRIVAAAAVPAPAAAPVPTGSQGVLPGVVAVSGDDGRSGTQQTAIALIGVSVLLVVLALVLATTSLRRRSLGGPPVEAPGAAPASD